MSRRKEIEPKDSSPQSTQRDTEDQGTHTAVLDRVLTLDEMMRERPSDFDFGDIEGLPEAVYLRATLKTMVGGFEYVGVDAVTGVEFWGRKPKLTQLSELFDLIEAAVEGEGRAALQAHLDRMAEIAVRLLYVQTEKAWRSATAEEVSGAFDLSELLAVKDRFFPMAVVAEGEAPVQPSQIMG